VRRLLLVEADENRPAAAGFLVKQLEPAVGTDVAIEMELVDGRIFLGREE
jgi:hypothetical protein